MAAEGVMSMSSVLNVQLPSQLLRPQRTPRMHGLHKGELEGLRLPASSPVPVKGFKKLAVRQQQTRASTVCAVEFTPQFKAALQKVLARQTNDMTERIGISSLQLTQHAVTAAAGGDGTGQLVWTSGVMLARHLRETFGKDGLRGKKVLELGTGTGIVGVSAALLGADALLTDLAEVLQLAGENCNLNSEAVKQAGGSASTAPLDWRRPDDKVLQRPFDIILGSDLVYDKECAPALAAVLQRVLESRDGRKAVMLMAHRHRRTDIDDNMASAFASNGLGMTLVDSNHEHPDEGENIAIYRITYDL